MENVYGLERLLVPNVVCTLTCHIYDGLEREEDPASSSLDFIFALSFVFKRKHKTDQKSTETMKEIQW